MSFFYILSGLFNMGVSPMSQTSIPRPLYHYTIPFYGVLSIILYMLATRLVQPARRWRMRRRDVLVGLGTLLLVASGIGLSLGARHLELHAVSSSVVVRFTLRLYLFWHLKSSP